MKNFTANEKKRIMQLTMQVPEEDRKSFLEEVSSHADAICSLKTLKGSLVGMGLGILWDFMPFTESVAGISDETIKWGATAIGGFLGYKEEKKHIDELAEIQKKFLTQKNN